MITTTAYQDTPTKTVDVEGVPFVYRDLGPRTGTPIIFLNHLAAVLDNWDPRVVDGLASQHRVITFDNRGVGASRERPRVRSPRWPTTQSPSFKRSGSSRLICRVLDGRIRGPSHRSGKPRACPQGHPRRNRAAGGEGIEKVAPLTYLDMVKGAVTFRDAKYYLFFTSTPTGRAAARDFLNRLKGAHREPRRRDFHLSFRLISKQSTTGVRRSRPICRASSNQCSLLTATTTAWCHAELNRSRATTAECNAHHLSRCTTAASSSTTTHSPGSTWFLATA